MLPKVDIAPKIAPRKHRNAKRSWDAVSEIEVFIAVVEAEIEVMEKERAGKARRGRRADPLLRRRLIGLLWTVTFGGMQWRLASFLSGIPFTTLHSAFARWTRLGLWRRLGLALAVDNRIAVGDAPMPSALPLDSRSCRSSPTAFAHGIDGGKKIKGIKLHAACDRHGSLIDFDTTAANTGDREGAVPILECLATLGFAGALLTDQGYSGPAFSKAAEDHGLKVLATACGVHDGRFLPQGIRWRIERTFAWLSRYRRLNVIFDRSADLFAGHVWIAMISIIARRLWAIEP